MQLGMGRLGDGMGANMVKRLVKTAHECTVFGHVGRKVGGGAWRRRRALTGFRFAGGICVSKAGEARAIWLMIFRRGMWMTRWRKAGAAFLSRAIS